MFKFDADSLAAVLNSNPAFSIFLLAKSFFGLIRKALNGAAAWWAPPFVSYIFIKRSFLLLLFIGTHMWLLLNSLQCVFYVSGFVRKSWFWILKDNEH